MSQEMNYSAIVARAWSDPNFRESLIRDGQTTLKQLGISLGEGVIVKVVEDTESIVHLVIPRRPIDISDDDIRAIINGNPEIMKITPNQVCTGPLSDKIC
ncbi:NHLP leader peptide family RiPP precursor [Methylomonas montana]|uniref:NHLP leader peptide family RiPP precursor n=1 Tax=Methylomonas montana TaxID=3058963 RepID=UPI002658D578|nr:NHLP leader peptide family RiPP precursor [Methylomonas montana]WKJ91334.1 NHLP leader peptide family RiPP precursor [Methylomonas montana]